MTAANLKICLFLLLATIGCGRSYYEQRATSQLPKADGSMLRVECLSHVEHTVSSVSPTLGSDPAVTIVQNDRTFAVTPEYIALNEKPYAKVPSDAKRVFIEIDHEGFEIMIDGQPAELLPRTR